MQLKKTFAGLLSVTVLSLSAVTALAADAENNVNITDQGNKIMLISNVPGETKQLTFNSFTGSVKDIKDFDGKEGTKIVYVENGEGGSANFIISSETYVLNNVEIKAGDIITGYYDANAPMIMIYPPQYNVEVVVVADKSQNVRVDRFDKDLVSSDNTLKLNVSDKTEIILEDGTAYKGELADRMLVVEYGISTRSIPAQTTPTKIVVLFEKAVPVIKNPSLALPDVSKMDIVVSNKKIEAPKAYTNEKGTVMVPLRAISEALGFEVTWNGENQSVMVGKGVSLSIGKDYYTYMKTAPIELGSAPELVNDRTFVPLSFFKKVVQMNNAYVFEAQIVVDNGEIMK